VALATTTATAEAAVVGEPAGGPAGRRGPGRLVDRLVAVGSEPVSGRSLAVVRVVVGAVGLLSAVRIVQYGWIDQLYTGPAHRFTYLGFGWVPQPSAPVMTGIVAAMAASSVALALGWRTRIAGAVLLVAFAWTELIDVTTYLNHYWFLTLILTLGLVLPWDGRPSVARGWVWLVRFQAGVVYTSAGLAKLQGDWLVRAQPLRLWLPPRADLPVVGPLLDDLATAHVMAVAGAAFDCSIVALLLGRRARPWAWAALVGFHVCTWLLFPIGVFPWLMIGVSTVFFAPDWPARLRTRLPLGELAIRSGGKPPDLIASSGVGGNRRGLLVGLAVVWVVVQVALPLRRLAYEGDHRWTGQGYRFAWNVLLVEKSGSVTFLVHDPATGRTRATDGSGLYTRAQIQVMATEPDLIHQAALALAATEADRGRPGAEVRVDAWVSFNGRPPARFIDPTVDLAAEPRDLRDDAWILRR